MRRMCFSLSLFALVSCADLSSFHTDPGESYQGVVLGGDDATCEDTASCSLLRRGFSSGTTLDMTFDPNLRDVSPGTLTTRGEACGLTLDHTPLLAIVPLAHDSLSLYDFPGGGRVRNDIYALRPETGPLAGRDMMAFVSLIEGGRIEVRLISGSGREPCEPDQCDRYARHECDYFGVFRLRRESVTP